MDDKKRAWRAEKNSYQRIFEGVDGRPVQILDIEPSQAGAVAYTVKPETGKRNAKIRIHLSYDHPVMNGLSNEEKYTFRKGVFAHEMMHQVFTPFRTEERIMYKYPVRERNIFGMICNVLEDPAIEYFAPTVIGGPLLASLRFAIAHTYKVSPNIEETDSAFGQYINALIQFGDMGPLKGHFTYPEAKDCFNKSAALFNQGVEEPDGPKRIEIAAQLHEISRPLWEPELEKEEFLKELSKVLSESGKSSMTGNGNGSEADESALPGEESKKSKRRKITIKKISKEEMEALKSGSDFDSEGSGEAGNTVIASGDGPGSGSGSLPDGDITVLVTDEDEKKSSSDNSSENSMPMPGDSSKDSEESKENVDGNGSGEKSDDENDSDKNGEDENSENESEKDQADGNDSESETESASGDKNGAFRTPGKTGKCKVKDSAIPDDFNDSDEKNEISEIDSEEYSLSDEDMDYIRNEMKELESKSDDEANGEDIDTSQPEDFNVESPKLGHKSCLNYRVSYDAGNRGSLEEAYEQTLAKLNGGIKSITTQLKRIFENDQEEREYKSSGRINVNRMNSGRVTSRIFDKRRAPVGKSNLSVMLLVDESGSMSCNGNYVHARECSIALAEIFNNLKVPVYIMGFTADTRGYDIVHNHYISWKNTHNERLKLLNISARSDNCDGYSIRYAAKLLKKQSKSEHKLLIVISDGQPAACNYYDGVADTRDAIKEAKKDVSVLGVAIGDQDTETIHYMYERDFLHVSNVKDLAFGLAKQIKNIVKGWE